MGKKQSQFDRMRDALAGLLGTSDPDELRGMAVAMNTLALTGRSDDAKAALPAVLALLDVVDGARHPIAELVERVHAGNDRWWRDLHTGERISRNVGELLMLTVSEIAEAMEGHRKSLTDAHLPHRTSIEVELADAVIRIFDIAGGLGLDLAGAFEDKLAYNATRADHTREARLAAGGKAY